MWPDEQWPETMWSDGMWPICYIVFTPFHGCSIILDAALISKCQIATNLITQISSGSGGGGSGQGQEANFCYSPIDLISIYSQPTDLISSCVQDTDIINICNIITDIISKCEFPVDLETNFVCSSFEIDLRSVCQVSNVDLITKREFETDLISLCGIGSTDLISKCLMPLNLCIDCSNTTSLAFLFNIRI
jgi:hypothetical protein